MRSTEHKRQVNVERDGAQKTAALFAVPLNAIVRLKLLVTQLIIVKHIEPSYYQYCKAGCYQSLKFVLICYLLL